MEQRDYLLQEIEKISQIIHLLIGKLSGSNSSNINTTLSEINDVLTEQLDINLQELIDLDEALILSKLTRLDDRIIEQLLELVISHIEHLTTLKQNTYNLQQLTKRGLLLIEYLDDKSKNYSMNRNLLKNKLQNLLSL